MTSIKITKIEYNKEVTIKIDEVNNNLIYTYYTSWSRFKVIPFSNPDIKNYLPGYTNVYNTYAKIMASDDERINTVPLAS